MGVRSNPQNPIWTGGNLFKKFARQSGWTSTISDSVSHSIGVGLDGISYEDMAGNVFWTEDTNAKIGVQNGFDTLTNDSLDVSAIDTKPKGCTFDIATERLTWIGDTDNKMYQYNVNGYSIDTTMADSVAVGNLALRGCGTDGTDFYSTDNSSDTFKRYSGFSGTVDDSFACANTPSGCAWDGTNAIMAEQTNDKLIQYTGFSATILDSVDVSGTSGQPNGPDHEDASERIGTTTDYESVVAASADDAHENSTGTVSITGTQLEFGGDSHATYRWVGLRFTDLPADLSGATVDFASLVMTPSQTIGFNDFAGTLYYEDGDSPAAFTTTDNDISDRTRSTATLTFSDEVIGAIAIIARPNRGNITSLIQDLCDNRNPSAIVLIYQADQAGTKRQACAAADNATYDACKLIIGYTAAPAPQGTGELTRTRFSKGVRVEHKPKTSQIGHPVFHTGLAPQAGFPSRFVKGIRSQHVPRTKFYHSALFSTGLAAAAGFPSRFVRGVRSTHKPRTRTIGHPVFATGQQVEAALRSVFIKGIRSTHVPRTKRYDDALLHTGLSAAAGFPSRFVKGIRSQHVPRTKRNDRAIFNVGLPPNRILPSRLIPGFRKRPIPRTRLLDEALQHTGQDAPHTSPLSASRFRKGIRSTHKPRTRRLEEAIFHTGQEAPDFNPALVGVTFRKGIRSTHRARTRLFQRALQHTGLDLPTLPEHYQTTFRKGIRSTHRARTKHIRPHMIDWAKRTASFRGKYRIFNTAEYRFYRTDGSAPAETDTPYATASSLPATPTTIFADGDWYISASYFNGVIDSGFLPLGSNGETYLRLLIVGDVEQVEAPLAPQDVRIEQSLGVVRVLALYVQEGANRADTWTIAYTTDGTTPAEDTADVTATIASTGVAVLDESLPVQSNGTVVKVRVQVRRSTTYSDGSAVLSATIDTVGPQAPEVLASYP